MRLSERQLNRATLDRQLLLGRALVGVADALGDVLALQAQEPASPYLALWNRVAGFDAAALDAAFADGEVVKATLLRSTLHAVRAGDWATFHGAMLPTLRGARLHDRRYTTTGLAAADADALLPRLAALAAVPRTRVEIEDLLEAELGVREPRLWWALKTFAPLHHVPTGGPWSFRRPSSFVAAPPAGAVAHGDAVRSLLLRYLRAFGPASVQDAATFTLLGRGVVRQALDDLRDDLVAFEGPGGATLVDVRGASLPPEDVAAPPRLLPMWDSVLLAYADRARVLPAEHRAAVIRRNGDVLPTLLVDGQVAGVWRAVDGGIEATAFRRLDAAAWSGLAAEADALVRFLADREPTVYARHAHWWDKGLPAAEVRTLP